MRIVAMGALLVCACSGNGEPPDARVARSDAPLVVVDAPRPDAPSPDAAAAQLCLAAREAWLARFATVDRSCDAPSDCSLIGEIFPHTCNGAPHVASKCEGDAANTVALAAARSDLERLELEWRQACATVGCGNPGKPCTADCAPGSADCVNHLCVTKSNLTGCFPPLIDAGM